MADALNQRIHHERIDPDATTITVARGQQVAVGDVVISRRNDPTIDIRDPYRRAELPASVRNGNRWRVAIVDTDNNVIGCERLDDKARVLFDRDYFREHVSLGYAVTVHSAQGVTADTSIAVLRDGASRNLLYVAMTRGRIANVAQIYEDGSEPSEFNHQKPAGAYITQRGDSSEAANLIHRIVANDEAAATAHDYAAQTNDEALPERVRDLLAMRAAATHRRSAIYQAWGTAGRGPDRYIGEHRERHRGRSQDNSVDHGLEL
jgi:hypothetical protein